MLVIPPPLGPPEMLVAHDRTLPADKELGSPPLQPPEILCQRAYRPYPVRSESLEVDLSVFPEGRSTNPKALVGTLQGSGMRARVQCLHDSSAKPLGGRLSDTHAQAPSRKASPFRRSQGQAGSMGNRKGMKSRKATQLFPVRAPWKIPQFTCPSTPARGSTLRWRFPELPRECRPLYKGPVPSSVLACVKGTAAKIFPSERS